MQHKQICTFSAELIKAELLMQMNFAMDCQSFPKIIKLLLLCTGSNKRISLYC